MVHAFCAHDEDVLRGIEQTDGGPDGGYPEPLWRMGACAGRIHIENRILRLRHATRNAANCRLDAADGMAN